MTKQPNPHGSQGPLDELVDALLECGGVLSQIISHMVAFEASGQSAPDAAPIPDVAHSLLHDVLAELHERYGDQAVEIAAQIVNDAPTLISDNIFMLD